MPDELVVCFTYNSQNIEGASAAASSFMHSDGARWSTVDRVWPIPMRVELAEKDKLEAARDVARQQFRPFLGISRVEMRNITEAG